MFWAKKKRRSLPVACTCMLMVVVSCRSSSDESAIAGGSCTASHLASLGASAETTLDSETAFPKSFVGFSCSGDWAMVSWQSEEVPDAERRWLIDLKSDTVTELGGPMYEPIGALTCAGVPDSDANVLGEGFDRSGGLVCDSLGTGITVVDDQAMDHETSDVVLNGILGCPVDSVAMATLSGIDGLERLFPNDPSSCSWARDHATPQTVGVKFAQAVDYPGTQSEALDLVRDLLPATYDSATTVDRPDLGVGAVEVDGLFNLTQYYAASVTVNYAIPCGDSPEVSLIAVSAASNAGFSDADLRATADRLSDALTC